MDWPTNEELENAAVAALNTEWSEEHPCSSNYYDLQGNP